MSLSIANQDVLRIVALQQLVGLPTIEGWRARWEEDPRPADFADVAALLPQVAGRVAARHHAALLALTFAAASGRHPTIGVNWGGRSTIGSICACSRSPLWVDGQMNDRSTPSGDIHLK
jgi:hypothetical protein